MKWFAGILFLFFALPVHGAPDLGTYRDIEGVRVFQDHKQAGLWYLSPAVPTLAVHEDGTADYALDVFRYHGRKGTGDQGAFKVHGVMSVAIERQRESSTTGKIRKALGRAGFKGVRLRSMPVTEANIKLAFGDQGNSWQQKTRWGGRQLVLPLTPEMTQVLWSAVENGQTLVSLSVAELFSGVRKKDKEWQDDSTSLSWTLPIEMDMTAHPGQFRKNDLGGRMSHGYTGIDVFCFDFIEELDPELYAKIVRVAIPTSGRELIEEITFRDDGEYRARIDFKLAKNMDRPYKVQVIRVLRDGNRQEGAWVHKQGESLLDITAYREPEESNDE